MISWIIWGYLLPMLVLWLLPWPPWADAEIFEYWIWKFIPAVNFVNAGMISIVWVGALVFWKGIDRQWAKDILGEARPVKWYRYFKDNFTWEIVS